jgi:hypothetical protein
MTRSQVTAIIKAYKVLMSLHRLVEAETLAIEFPELNLLDMP